MGFDSLDDNNENLLLDLPKSQIDLAEQAYHGYRVIFSETFMKKSKESYPPEWLIREIVQNFVDANVRHPGTLNGVTVKKEPLDDSQYVRWTITGDWPFLDYTGLITLHSDKTEEQETAGGNGIGLKQTALGFLRDQNVTKFSVIGEKWSAEYKLASSHAINQRLEQAAFPERVKTGFLLAKTQRHQNTGACHYVLDVAVGSAVDRILEDLCSYGVCDQNPNLQDMDYANRYGAVKWLPPLKTDKPRFAAGRFYLNGQIYRFSRYSGESKLMENDASDYWGGPLGMTLQLNNLKTAITLDRPAMDAHALTMWCRWFLESMSKDDLIKNIKLSEPLWANGEHYEFDWAVPFPVRFIRSMVDRLEELDFSEEEYGQHFGDKKYYCYNLKLTEREKQKLQKEGYVFCPDFFSAIHMPIAPVEEKPLDPLAINIHNVRKRMSDVFMELFDDCGLEVPFCRIDADDATNLGRIIQKVLKTKLHSVNNVADRPNSVQISFKLSSDKEDLIHTGAVNQNSPDTLKACHFIKGICHNGLSRNIFESAILFSKDFQTTFAVSPDGKLMIRNAKLEVPASDLSLQVTFPDAQKLHDFLEGLKNRPKKKFHLIPRTIQGRIAATALAAIGLGPCIGIGFGVLQDKLESKEKSTITSTDRLGVPKITIKKQRPVPAPVPQVKSYSDTPNSVNYATATAIIAVLAAGAIGYGVASRYKQFAAAQAQAKSPQPVPEIHTAIDAFLRSGVAFYANPSGHTIETDTPAVSLSDVVKNFDANAVVPASRRDNTLPAQDDREDCIVEDFAIVEKPSTQQLAQLGLLREFFHLTTGYFPHNNLLIYRGKGSLGFNRERIIALHEALFSCSFEEALSTFTHEITHNEVRGHGPRFFIASEALFAAQEHILLEIGRQKHEERSETAKRILEIEAEWDSLMKKN